MVSKSHRKSLCPILKNAATTLNTAAPAMVALTTTTRTTMATTCVASTPTPAVTTPGAAAATAADRAGCLATVACAWCCCN